MQPVTVIVAAEFGEDLAQVTFAEDQNVIQALASERAHEPLGKSIRTRRPDWRLDHARPVPGEDLIEGRVELAVPVAEQELEPPRLARPGPSASSGPAARSHSPDGCAVTPRICTAGSGSPARPAHTDAAVAPCPHAGNRTPRCPMPEMSGTAARSATPAARRAEPGSALLCVIRSLIAGEPGRSPVQQIWRRRRDVARHER
jgi:hypothetical protein